MFEINIDEVIRIYGELSSADANSGANLTFVQIAIFHLNSKLLRAPQNEHEQDLVHYACACTAYYNCVLLNSTFENNFETPTATITTENSSKSRVCHAKSLLDLALSEISPLLKDNDFVFISVRG